MNEQNKKTCVQSEKKYYYRFLCSIILCLVATGMFYYVWVTFVRVNNQTNALTGYGNLGMATIIYILLYWFAARGFRGFRIGVERKANIIASQIIALMIVDVIEVLISMAITGQFRFFWQFTFRYALLFMAQSVVLGLLVIPMINFYRRIFPPISVVEIYGDNMNEVAKKMDAITYKYHIAESIRFSDDKLEEAIGRNDAVLVNDVPAEARNEILKLCFNQDKRVYSVPKISDIIIKASEELNLIDTPIYLSRNNGLSTIERIVKRTFDFVFSFLALIVLSPILLITAIAIKIGDGGPVFYKQERATIGNRRFMIIKFRSMIVDAEKDGRSHPAREKDDRITKVGRFIRATRIDELPQLINILKGDMSIVGPRPERVEHIAKYTADIPEFSFRSKVKGGLTGYAQVYGKYNTTALDKLKLDLVYIMNYSILLDFQIIMETIKVLFQKESTEGFSKERAAEIHDSEIPCDGVGEVKGNE